MSLEGFLRTVVQALTDAGIPAMLTGSLAAAYHGAARATMDIDLVVEPNRRSLEAFAEAMERAGFYVSVEAARAAVDSRGMFNVIDPETGWKADLIVRKERPFSQTEFARRLVGEFGGVRLGVVRIEDLIVAKLEWAKLGASARQIEDVRTLVQLSAADVDLDYVERWVDALGLHAEWASTRMEKPE